MQVAFIVSTEDDGLDESEDIQGDEVINISWAIPNNAHTDTTAEYEAGVMQYYGNATPDDPSLPIKQWTLTQTTTKVLNVNSARINPG